MKPAVPLCSLLFLFPAATGLTAQKGGGSTPPPNPAIAFAESGIRVMNADGTNVRTVVSLARGDWASTPTWSPSGQRLAFAAKLAGQAGIWTVNLDGTARQRISAVVPDGSLDWSRGPCPDGREKLAFTAPGVGGESDLFVVNTDGTGLQNLSGSPEAEWTAARSRDARGLYVGWADNLTSSPDPLDWWGAWQIQVGAALGGGLEPISATEMLPGWFVGYCAVAHSHDLLLFHGGNADSPSYFEHWFVATDALPWQPVRVFPGSVLFGFSPDDQKVVLENSGICTANLDGSGFVRIRRSGSSPAWRHN